jgi:Ca2+:H+ antiporter
VLLFAATAAVAYASEAFVGAIEPLTEEYGISELFVGVILVPIVGNIAEHIVGVQIAYKNNMDFSMGISLRSPCSSPPSSSSSGLCWATPCA